MALGEGLSVLARMFQNWIINRDRDEHKFDPTLKVSDEDWERGYSVSKKWLMTQLARTEKFFLCKPENHEFVTDFDKWRLI